MRYDENKQLYLKQKAHFCPGMGFLLDGQNKTGRIERLCFMFVVY